MKRIVLHIDSLVLKGFRYEDRHAVAQGLREELARALIAPAAAARIAQRDQVARLPAIKTNIAVGARPQSIGTAVGGAIGRTIKR